MYPSEYRKARALEREARSEAEKYFYGVYAEFLNIRALSIEDARKLALAICSAQW